MPRLRHIAAAAALLTATLGLASPAAAYMVCNRWGNCWNVPRPYYGYGGGYYYGGYYGDPYWDGGYYGYPYDGGYYPYYYGPTVAFGFGFGGYGHGYYGHGGFGHGGYGHGGFGGGHHH